MKDTLLSIEEERSYQLRENLLQPCMAFSFVYYRHIYSSSNQSIARMAKLGVVKGVANIFPTTHSSILLF